MAKTGSYKRASDLMGCWKPAKAEHRSERDRSNYKATCVSRETQTNEFLPYSGFSFSRNRVAKSLYTFFFIFLSTS